MVESTNTHTKEKNKVSSKMFYFGTLLCAFLCFPFISNASTLNIPFSTTTTVLMDGTSGIGYIGTITNSSDLINSLTYTVVSASNTASGVIKIWNRTLNTQHDLYDVNVQQFNFSSGQSTSSASISINSTTCCTASLQLLNTSVYDVYIVPTVLQNYVFSTS